MTSDAVQTFRIAGLRAPADIRIDQWGVPHIRAQSRHDAFVAQGFNAARDRLWQIDLWRKRGLGLLAENFGPGYLEQDRAARLFLYRGDMAAEWPAYGAPDAEESASAFVAGINSFIALTERDASLLPPEFIATGTRPQRWEAADVVRIRSHGLIHNLETETTRAQVLARSNAETDLARRSLDPPHAYVVPDGLDVADVPPDVLDVFLLATAPATFSRDRLAASLDQACQWSTTDDLGNIIHDPEAEGSNNWAVAPSRSATGRPILASDPHRAYMLPSLRYVAHLTAPGLDIIGAGEPALPGISIGHNGRVAFGLTIFRADQEDLYVYETHPDDPDLYRYQDGWERMHVVHETIRVKGTVDQNRVLKFTRHGPVVKEDHAGHRAFAVRTVWMEPGAAPYFGSIAYQDAASVAEFNAALDHWSTPSVNHVFADTNGSIGWAPASKAPRRPNWDGLLPVPGDGRYEWNGFHPHGALPRTIDPPCGYVATANEMTLPEGPSRELGIGYEWSEPFRARRIHEVFAAQPVHGIDDALCLQCDTLSIPARRLCALLDDLTSEESDVKAALALLRGWDHRLETTSPAALLFEFWWMKHLKPALLDRLAAGDAELRSLLAPGDQVTLIGWLESSATGLGFDNIAMRDALLRRTLADAMNACRVKFGSDTLRWSWSSWHHGYFEHPLSNTGPASIRDVGPLAKGGSGFTVMNNAYRLSDGRAITGASFRMLIDVGAWDNSRFVNAPGQSGNPASPHYDDHAPAWSEGSHFPLLYSSDAIEAATRRRILLEPSGE